MGISPYSDGKHPDARAAEGAAPQVQVNQEALTILESMGFPTVRSQKALLATGNSNAEAAMEWLIEHSDDMGKVY